MSERNRAPNVWMFHTGEPPPIGGQVMRAARNRQICDKLAAAGANVTWWASTFDHKAKRYFAEPGHVERSASGVEMRLLHGRPYARNVSVARILHQRDLARDFKARAASLPPPDIIYTGLPTIEVAHAATAYAARVGAASFVDYRDLWPEIFLDVSPLPRALTRIAIEPFYRQARAAFSRATGIVSITPAFLDAALALAGRARQPADLAAVHAYPKPVHTEAELAEADAAWRAQGLALDGSQHIVCFFGEMSAAFEPDPVIEGLARMEASQRARFRLVMCGPGAKLEALRARAAGLPELVAPGFVNSARIQSLMRVSRAGLLPYSNRKDLLMSYPNKVGEYLSAGLPILSSLDGETGRLLREKNCGLVVGADEWRDALARVAENSSDHLAMRKSAAQTYAETFEPSDVYGKLAAHILKFGGFEEFSRAGAGREALRPTDATRG